MSDINGLKKKFDNIYGKDPPCGEMPSNFFSQIHVGKTYLS